MRENRAARTTLADLPDPHPYIMQLLDAWREARDGDMVPLKRRFDPSGIPALLAKVWLYARDSVGPEYRCRLAGEDINRTWGRSIAGNTARSLFGADDSAVIAEIWDQVLDTPLIHYGKAEQMLETSFYAAERIVVPLASDGNDGTTGYVLGISLYGSTRLDKVRPEQILTNAFQIHCADID